MLFNSILSSEQVFQLNGQLSSSAHKVSFAQCPPGTFQNGSEIECAPCGPGTVADIMHAGFTTDVEGYKQWPFCQSLGTYSSVEGRAECNRCEAGTFSNDTYNVLCSDCKAGYFSDTEVPTVLYRCMLWYLVTK